MVSAEKVNSVHSYPQVDVDEDKEAYDRNTTKIQHELSLPHPSGEKLSELMKRTFPERRKWVLQGAESSQQIWSKFPPLKTASYVSFYDEQISLVIMCLCCLPLLYRY